MGFIWHWFTKAGSTRHENQDYSGIAQWGDSLFAIITDGVSSCPDSGHLACALTRYLVDQVIANDDPPTSADITCYLKEGFTSLKQSCSPNASAAFLAAYFSADKLMYTVHAGDCRIGLKSDEGPIAWMTEVHSLANAITPLEEDSLRVHPARNQLTRSFGTRRYKAPDITTLACEYVEGVALATDGFWAGLPVHNQHAAFSEDWAGPHDNEDDVSRLIIRWSHSTQTWAEDSAGIYVKRR